jgi:hypothetical protein
MLYVRMEKRYGDSEGEFLFVYMKDGTVYERWFPIGDAPPEFELIHDTGGRAEAQVFLHNMREAERRERAMLAAMKRAVSILDNESAMEVRKVYTKQLKESG